MSFRSSGYVYVLVCRRRLPDIDSHELLPSTASWPTRLGRWPR